ncbi:uncharacterized protein DSM5745_04806 [Aspergillus mulundensis]|uniref:Uncharacterized protein n=1 Tax=Aspergillus mulundensis TaxID=1810919 RepID=A0A3D8S4P5_9EURO|nr:hypothetical protein DSM5745_04806 [Aspergillus mulundensis]RDW81249.1 hypothetical protein DSM5745_04806 [Aspergillus mulundensis]
MFLFKSPDPDLTKEVVEFPSRINNRLESYVTRLLEEVGIPSFIWGEPYLSILGSTTGALVSLPLPRLIYSLQSRASLMAKLCTHPYPDYHWHTDLKYFELPKKPGDLIFFSGGVHLFRKSRLFWEFPDPPLGAPPKDDPYYMLTSDPRINERYPCHVRGRQPEGYYPVKMPVPARYFEAMVLLRMRDVRARWLDGCWSVNILYLLDSDHILLLNLDTGDINEPFPEYAKRRIYEGYEKEKGHEYKYLLEMFLDYKRKGKLPPPERPPREGERSFEALLQHWKVPYEQSDLIYG